MNNYNPNSNQHNVARPIYKLTELIWYALYIVETILFFRFVLKLLGANPAAWFSNFIYNLSYPFVSPFLYVLGPDYLGQYVISWNTLLAMLVYSFLAWILVRLIWLAKPVTHKEAEESFRREE